MCGVCAESVCGTCVLCVVVYCCVCVVMCCVGTGVGVQCVFLMFQPASLCPI